MINDFFQRAKVQRKVKGRKRYTLNNVNRQKITSRMLEDEADENRYPFPMALNEYFSSNNMDNWNKCITFAA